MSAIRKIAYPSDRKTITINDVDLGGRVWLIKEAVQQKEGVPPSSQRLIFSGKQLQDDILVSSYGIVAGSSLHLVLRLKGGLRSQLSLYTLAGLPVEGIT